MNNIRNAAEEIILRELKATVKKLMQAVKNTLPVMVEKLETLRQNMIIFRYQLLHIATGKSKMNKRLSVLCPELERYLRLVKQIRDKTKHRNLLLDERKATPVWNLPCSSTVNWKCRQQNSMQES